MSQICFVPIRDKIDACSMKKTWWKTTWMAETFAAKIDVIGVNPHIKLPDDVLQGIFKAAGKDKSPIRVRGTIDGAAFRQSLVRYQGDWRLYINSVMARAAGFKFSNISQIVGQPVTISVEYDPQPVTYQMVPEFQKVLDSDAIAKAAYDQLTPGRQKEILRYLASLKSEVALQRNITRVMQHLRGEESDALYALMHRRPKA